MVLTDYLIVTGTSSPLWATRWILRKFLHKGRHTTITFIVYIFSKNGICEINIWAQNDLSGPVPYHTVLSLVQIRVSVVAPYRRLYFDNFFSNKNNIFMIMVRYGTARSHYRYGTIDLKRTDTREQWRGESFYGKTIARK